MANINMTQEQLDNVVTAINNRAKISVVETKTSAMTKAQFNGLAEERKANRGGSGFDEWGNSHNTGILINNGMCVFNTTPNLFLLGSFVKGTSTISKTSYPLIEINGVVHKLDKLNDTNANQSVITLPTAPTIYPHDTVLTTEQLNSGVIKHADSSNSGLIVNGKFDTDTAGWIGSGYTVSSNTLLLTNPTSAEAYAYQNFTTVVGKKYVVEITLTIGTATIPKLQLKTALAGATILNQTYTTGGRYVVEFTATTLNSTIIVSTNTTSTGLTAIFDNIAVYPADAISRSDLVFLELTKIAV